MSTVDISTSLATTPSKRDKNEEKSRISASMGAGLSAKAKESLKK